MIGDNETRYGLRLKREGATAWLVLSRPERHNALDERLIAALTEALDDLADDDDIRQVVLTGDGKSFCAGADIDWMRRTAAMSPQENEREAMDLARLLRMLDELPKPTIAAVNGGAYGGGVGLVACCDIAIGVERARLVLTEVRLGIVAGVISPYIIRAIGPRAVRRAVLTASPITAEAALTMGLLHEITAPEALDAAVKRVCAELAEGGPRAQATTKQLVRAVAGRPVDDTLLAETARAIATARASAEGREGVAAFFEKRPPRWRR